MEKKLKIQVESPVTVSFMVLCIIATFIRLTTPWPYMASVSAPGELDLRAWYFYSGLLFHVFGHANWGHFFSNLTLFMVLSPAIETRIGSKTLAQLIAAVALATSLGNLVLSDNPIIGASGIVLALIILNGAVDMTRDIIPVSMLLVIAMFLGKEMYFSVQLDKVSQFAHILGGLIGLLYSWRLVDETEDSTAYTRRLKEGRDA